MRRNFATFANSDTAYSGIATCNGQRTINYGSDNGSADRTAAQCRRNLGVLPPQAGGIVRLHRHVDVSHRPISRMEHRRYGAVGPCSPDSHHTCILGPARQRGLRQRSALRGHRDTHRRHRRTDSQHHGRAYSGRRRRRCIRDAGFLAHQCTCPTALHVPDTPVLDYAVAYRRRRHRHHDYCRHGFGPPADTHHPTSWLGGLGY